jgi:hypothetical protein
MEAKPRATTKNVSAVPVKGRIWILHNEAIADRWLIKMPHLAPNGFSHEQQRKGPPLAGRPLRIRVPARFDPVGDRSVVMPADHPPDDRLTGITP